MRGGVPPLLNTSSFCGAQLHKRRGCVTVVTTISMLRKWYCCSVSLRLLCSVKMIYFESAYYSSVSKVTESPLDGRDIKSWYTYRDFSLCHHGSVTHSVPYPTGVRPISRRTKLTIHLHLVPRSRTHASVSPIPCTSSRRVAGLEQVQLYFFMTSADSSK
jgi:hypothetical protein